MANGDQREFILWILKNKYDALADVDQALIAALADPTNDRAKIETHLDEDNIERTLLLAKYDAVDAGKTFKFPSSAEIQNLRLAIKALETAVAQSAKVDALLKAAAGVEGLVKASKV
jgi:hypothetical protein